MLSNGIAVFSGTATRDAAFGSAGEKTLAEGQFAYLEASKATQYYNGSAWVGVGGLVPITPTSVVVTAGTATVGTMGQVTFTTANGISLNGVFSSLYNNYRVVYRQSSASATTTAVELRVAGVNASTNYYVVQSYVTANTVVGDTPAVQTLWYATINTSTTRTMSFDVINPFAAAQTVFNGGYIENNTTTVRSVAGGCVHTTATSYDGLTFSCGANVSGTVTVYGYNQ